MLLAENAKTIEFRSLTDTPAFRAWFRGSRIVGADGEPLLVWHGLKNPVSYVDALNKRVLFAPDFDTFDVSKGTELGAWFSPDPAVADLYGYPAPFFLRALNPVREEGTFVTPPPGCDAVYRTRSSRAAVWDAWEIAVFDAAQVSLAFTPSELVALR